MTRIETLLTQYAAYHRDRRNILTHFVGVPMIVFSIIVALWTVPLPGESPATGVTLGSAVALAAAIYYLLLDRILGITMLIVLFLMCAGASELTARVGSGVALGWAAGLFIVGWALQFLGHKFEGMKPAFFDDAKQLLIGPLFVCAEAFFMLGAKPGLRRYIEERVGPTVPRRDGRPLPLSDVAHE
jgi:uncharacterized membrane protein YGL010W